MAKISAGGATKLDEAKADSGVAMILCSDGRILRRYPSSMGGGMDLFGKVRDAKTASEADLRAAFSRLCSKYGWRR